MDKNICRNCARPIPGLPGQPRRHYSTWICRGCGAECCRHFCGNKVDKMASCAACKRSPIGFNRPGIANDLGGYPGVGNNGFRISSGKRAR